MFGVQKFVVKVWRKAWMKSLGVRVVTGEVGEPRVGWASSSCTDPPPPHTHTVCQASPVTQVFVAVPLCGEESLERSH